MTELILSKHEEPPKSGESASQPEQPCQAGGWAVIQKPDSSYELWSLPASYTQNLFRRTSVWDPRMALLKITQTWSLCTSVSFSVCTPPLRPQVTKHCFWHLSYPTRFHKSYWTGNTQSLKIYFFCGRHCSLYESWSDEDNLSSGDVWIWSWSSYCFQGPATDICHRQPPDYISFLWAAMIGFAMEIGGTYF